MATEIVNALPATTTQLERDLASRALQVLTVVLQDKPLASHALWLHTSQMLLKAFASLAVLATS